MSHWSRFLLAHVGLMVLASLSAPLVADDWPQWMGPKRDNIWRETGLLEKFPEGGPKVLWRAPVAGGYAGPAVSGNRVFITDFVSQDNIKTDNFKRAPAVGKERILCLDQSTGKELWRHEYPVSYEISYPAGPRCTPTVDGDRVYTLGAEGNLFCLNVSDGKVLWSKEFKKEYDTKSALWGYASHPLIDGDKIICVVGTEVAHAAAFNKLTGEEIWRAGKATEQAYCPPTIIEAGGRRQLILMKALGIYSVDPETGKPFWEFPYKADSGSVIMTPIKIGDYLYVGGFQERNLLLKLNSEKPEAEVVWQDKQRHGISPVNTQPFVVEDVLYGFHEKGDLHAVQIPSGEILWRSRDLLNGRAPNSGTAFIVKQGDRFWMFTETGDLVIANLTPTGFTELDRTPLLKPTNFAFGREVVWCPPAFANRCIIVRNDEECICVSLAK
ncbi:PQQ-binding-like beta-propeller repeat protein [Planctomicrobium sp. SH527]|uniref:PQQ-binding-like beta-propeller repeat protein n=1 Tax=Planctomicrobium sp. SH527 TaxID=3448123 RepID=UPI003F5C3456